MEFAAGTVWEFDCTCRRARRPLQVRRASGTGVDTNAQTPDDDTPGRAGGVQGSGRAVPSRPRMDVDVDRLDQVLVEPDLERALAVGLLAKAADRHQPDVPVAQALAHLGGHAVAVELGQTRCRRWPGRAGSARSAPRPARPSPATSTRWPQLLSSSDMVSRMSGLSSTSAITSGRSKPACEHRRAGLDGHDRQPARHAHRHPDGEGRAAAGTLAAAPARGRRAGRPAAAPG